MNLPKGRFVPLRWLLLILLTMAIVKSAPAQKSVERAVQNPRHIDGLSVGAPIDLDRRHAVPMKALVEDRHDGVEVREEAGVVVPLNERYVGRPAGGGAHSLRGRSIILAM